MTETEATIKVLDRLAGPSWTFTSGKYTHEGKPAWHIVCDNPPSCDVVQDGNKFYFRQPGWSTKTKFYGGFELLEKLAEYPFIAAKLAEPIK